MPFLTSGRLVPQGMLKASPGLGRSSSRALARLLDGADKDQIYPFAAVSPGSAVAVCSCAVKDCLYSPTFLVCLLSREHLFSFPGDIPPFFRVETVLREAFSQHNRKKSLGKACEVFSPVFPEDAASSKFLPSQEGFVPPPL